MPYVLQTGNHERLLLRGLPLKQGHMPAFTQRIMRIACSAWPQPERPQNYTKRHGAPVDGTLI